MNTIQKIEKILSTNVLIAGLCYMPEKGATDEEIRAEEETLKVNFNHNHKILLKKWNGINLDVLRIFGCISNKRIQKISNNQFDLLEAENLLVFGSDPNGFLYGYNKEEFIFSIDSDGGSIEKVAISLEEFICDYVFGKRAAEFAGEEWLQELKDAGIV